MHSRRAASLLVQRRCGVMARSSVCLSSSSSLLAAVTAVRMACRGYALHASSVRLQRDGNSGSGHKGKSESDGAAAAAAAAAAEDREELERERALRAQFVEKIQRHSDAAASEHGTPYVSSSSSSSYRPPVPSSGSDYQQQQQQSPPLRFAPGMQPPSHAMQRTFRFFFFLFALMLLMSMLSLMNPRSPVYVMQGLPWWQLPIATTAYYMLLRIVYPRSEEERLRLEYATASRSNPHLTFDQFINQQHPTMFQGYRVSQAEVVAAVAACLSAARDMRFVQTMRRAAGRATDPKKAVDDIVDALRNDYPQLF